MIPSPKKIGGIEKVFAASLILYAILQLSGAAVTANLVAIVAYLLGATVLFRLVQAGLKRAVWRLRNRLIVSYLFIAGVPMALLVLLVAVSAYVLIGQMAIYVVTSELDHRNAPPEPTREFLASLVPNLGDVFFLHLERDRDLDPDLRRRYVPPRANLFDIELTWFAPIKRPPKPAVLVVRSRPSAILRILFGKRMEWDDRILVIAVVLACLLLVCQLISITIGANITRRITGAVHDLYAGTRKIKEGDFSHRIAVHGTDQLAELVGSFNVMTENLERLIVVEKEKERLHSELEIATEVQRNLFPKSVPSLKSLHLAGICHPAQMVSGDYYDYLSLENSSVAMALGDVAGKGISAALLMATIQAAMRAQLTAPGKISTAQVVSMLNRQLYASTSLEKYATFYFGIYDDASRLLTYTNAGHLPPIILRNGTPTRLDTTGTVVGAFPLSIYEERQVSLRCGDILVAYTDGITEPENSYGEMFGEDRLLEVLLKYQSADSDEMISRTMESVCQWTGSSALQDDMTMLLARCTSESA